MKNGQLSVWWIPQVPMKAFRVNVADMDQAKLVMDTLADYDLFQFEHNIKPDYCNTGGISSWCADCDGDGTPGWEDVDEWEAA